MKRNLHYFVYPRAGSAWRWNVDELRSHLGAFNGRHLIAVAQDKTTDPTSDIARALGDSGATFFEWRNDPARGEGVSFVPMMERLASLDPSEATFYAHAKGIRHTEPVLGNVKAWVRAMLGLSLSDLSLIERLLGPRGAVGAFRREMPHEGSSWHYSGAFFWVRHSVIFSRDWRGIHPGIYGVEAWPGRHLGISESWNLTLGRDYGDLYKTSVPEASILELLNAQRALAPAGA